MTLSKNAGFIADLVEGRLVGSADVELTGVESLAEANPSQVSFLGNKKYIPQIQSSKAGVVFLPEGFSGELNESATYIYVKDPSVAFSAVVDLFAPASIEISVGIHKTAIIAADVEVPASSAIGPNVVIESGVKLGENCKIGAGCYIGHETVLGDDCWLHPNVVIRERCLLGNRVAIHSGSTIGSDGFGYIPGANGHTKIPQVGTVQIDDDVELGANVTVDRARFGRTWIKQGTKIDNLVQVGHNVTIGKYCFICAQVGIAGSTELGDRVVAAGQVGFSGHITVGDGTTAMGQAGVIKDVGPGELLFGTPAIPRKEFAKQSLSIKKVAKLEEELKRLKGMIAELVGK